MALMFPCFWLSSLASWFQGCLKVCYGWPGYRKKNVMYSHPGSLKALLISLSHFCRLSIFWVSLDTLKKDSSGDSSVYIWYTFLRKQSCLFDAPPLILDRTILLELQFLDHQTSKTEKVKVHPGSRLIYNYKFLTGLYVGVMLHVFVCLVMTMTHSPSTAFMWAPRDPPATSRPSLQGERKCSLAPGLPSSDYLGWRWSLQVTSLSPLCPVLTHHRSFLHTVWDSWS